MFQAQSVLMGGDTRPVQCIASVLTVFVLQWQYVLESTDMWGPFLFCHTVTYMNIDPAP